MDVKDYAAQNHTVQSIYEIISETEKTEKMGRMILDKPVKVVSPAIISIKNEVEQKIKLE